MKKVKLVSCIFLFFNAFVSAQDFPGFRSSNNPGIHGVYFNPAHVADSRYRFDANLFGISTSVGNNQASFRLKTIGETFNADSLKNKVFGDNAGTSSGIINLDVHGPAAMLSIGKKSGLAITTRARSMANILDLDGKLVKSLIDDFSRDPQFPYAITSNENMRMSVNAWAEIGVSYGSVLLDQGAHYIKGGATIKYLGGVANGFVSLDNFKGTLNDDILAQDVYLTNTTGRISTGFGGNQIEQIDLNKLTKMESSGLGADMGLLYEYRPNNENSKSNGSDYQFKAGISLLDIGSIRYNKDMKRSGSYNINITGSNRFYLGQIADSSIDGYNAYFKSRPQYFTPVGSNAETSYSVSLPATIQMELDYKIKHGFYAALSAQIPVNKESSQSSRYYSSFTLTPRYEGRVLGVYLPINHNDLTDFNVGLALRVGPVFLGSGSLFTAAFGESKQADFYLGFHVGALKK